MRITSFFSVFCDPCFIGMNYFHHQILRPYLRLTQNGEKKTPCVTAWGPPWSRLYMGFHQAPRSRPSLTSIAGNQAVLTTTPAPQTPEIFPVVKISRGILMSWLSLCPWLWKIITPGGVFSGGWEHNPNLKNYFGNKSSETLHYTCCLMTGSVCRGLWNIIPTNNWVGGVHPL